VPISQNIYTDFDRILDIPSSDRDKLFLALDEVISHIQSLLLDPEYSSSSNERAELLYLLGYAYYQYPDRDNNRDVFTNVEKYLSLAVEIDPSYSIAWLYLGHNAYDMGKYNDAKERFSRCQENHFGSFYRLILIEMKLCTSIKIEGLAKMIGEVEKFVDLLESDDAPQDIFPYVLISIIEKDITNIENPEKDKANILLSRLQNI
jgi:tetratricopeptide (TPR) repeat protein